jgi:hypothetical protein
MSFPTHMSLLRRGVIVSAAALAVAVPIVASGAAGASGPVAKSAAKGAVTAAPAKYHVFTDSNGNRVEMIDPGQSTYIPNVAGASDADRAFAQQILDGVNEFCRTHTVKHIKAHWRPGGMDMHMKSGMQMKGMSGMQMKGMSMQGMTMNHTHWFNPNKLTGIHPRRPVAALIYKGVLDGVMFNGGPVLRALGSIPRPHVHSMPMKGTTEPLEMVHVYCTRSLKYAFTPNRQLGVMVPVQNLRNEIRPAVMLLKPWQLKEVRRMVRHMCGDRLAPVRPGTSDGTGPDPVLQAMRTEIRRSLMILREGQLRSVWQKMRSYASVPG